MNESTVLYEYLNILHGHQRGFKLAMNASAEANKKEAGYVWRYVVSKMLRWTPQEALVYLTPKIIKETMLDRTFPAFGKDLNPEAVYEYSEMLHYAFPGEIRYSLKEETINIYKRTAKVGEFAKDNAKRRKMKGFFFDTCGVERAKILLNFIVGEYLSDYTIIELYDFFADDKAALSWLKEKKLAEPVLKGLYASPLDYLHKCIKPERRSNFLYYSALANKQTAKGKKKKK